MRFLPRFSLVLAVLTMLAAPLSRADDPAPATPDAGALVANDSPNPSPNSLIKPNEKVVFLGDLITQQGWENANGYVHLVVSGLKANGISILPIPEGLADNTSTQLLARLQKDALDKKPDWLLVSSGINDVGRTRGGVAIDKYKANLTSIVEQAQAANIKVMILTTTVIGEDLSGANNKKLADYNAFLRDLAKDKKTLLADVNGAIQTALQAAQQGGKKPGGALTKPDGVHMNPRGDLLIATTILETVALSSDEITKAENLWHKLDPSTTTRPATGTGGLGRRRGR